jgi:NAD/NADP transhydrogenase beta subunit
LATWIPGIGGHAGTLFFVVVCVSWALVTFLVMPVIVFEAQPNIWARLRRSEELLKRTWGEQVFGRLSVLVLLYAIMAVFVVPLLLASHAGWVSASVTHLLFIILLIVLNPLLGAIGAAIQSIYSAACYSYAVTGMLPQEFGPELLPQSKGD